MFTRKSERLLFLISAFLATAASADIIYVDAKRPQQGADGNCWCSAYPTLQQALDDDELGAGDEIWVARYFLQDGVTPGSYKPTARYPDDTDPRHATFLIPAGVKVYGGFRGADADLIACDGDACDLTPNPSAYPGESDLRERNPEVNITILDGDIGVEDVATDNCYHVVYFHGGDPVFETKLSGFTILGGYADGAPGEGDQAGDDRGGGILAHWLEGTVTNVLLNRLVIEDNYAETGGAGVYLFAKGTTFLTQCRIQHNQVNEGWGAGLLADLDHGGTVPYKMQNCAFVENTINRGAGAAVAFGSDGPVGDDPQLEVISNCTFYGNVCYDILEPSEPWYFEFSTVGAVVSPGSGNQPGNFSSFLTVNNCILWANSEPQLGVRVAACNSIVGDSSEWTGMRNYDFEPCTNSIPDNPKFRSPPTNLRVLPASPAIDFGNDAFVLADWTDVNDAGGSTERTPWDLAKYRRFVSTVDAGVYEHCPGDLDDSGDVGLSDLTMLLSCFGQSPCDDPIPWCCIADVDEDADVDIQDLSNLLSLFGTSCRLGAGLTGEGEAAMSGDDPLSEWIRNATVEEILDWWRAGMPPIGEW